SLRENAVISGACMAEIDSETSRRAKHLSATIDLDQWVRLLVVTATLLLLTLAVAVGVRLASAIGHTLLLFSLGGLLAYALDPLVEWLKGSRTGRKARSRSVLIVFGAIALLLALGVWLLGDEMSRQLQTLQHDHALYAQGMRPDTTPEMHQLALQTYEEHTREKLRELDGWLAGHGVKFGLEQNLDNPSPKVKTLGQQVADRALKVFEGVGRAAVESVIVLLIALYFMIYAQEMREGVNRGLPPRLRGYSEQWMEDVNRILGGFVRGQLVLALAMGALAGGICLAVGIKLWLLIGLFVVVMSLIPVVGPYIGAVPAVIAALVTPAHGLFNPVSRAVIVLVVFVFINEFGSKILYPKLVGAALGLHEVLVLFILLAGFEVGGLTGVLFAAPLTALSAVTLVQLYRLWQGLPPASLAAAAQHGAEEARADT
ncbi:MAG TPA: AI-2E family transporter, partial [Chloroflexota bacterium]|nr:AI-2E family transporter [Chloroflexota bacterium]